MFLSGERRSLTGILFSLCCVLFISACASSESNDELKPSTSDSQSTVPAATADQPAAPTADAGQSQSQSTLLQGPPKAGLTAPDSTQPGPIKIGLLLPLSGSSADVGQALFEAAQLALFDIGNPRLTLLPKDTRGTPEGAAAAADAVLSEGAEIILGPLFSRSVEAVAARAETVGVNVVAFSNDRTAARSGVFLMGLFPDAQIDKAVRHANRQGLRRFAALVPDSDYGSRVIGALEKAVYGFGGELVQVERFPANAQPGDDSLTESVKRLADYDRRHNELLQHRKELEARDDELSRKALKRLQGIDAYGDLDFDAVVLADGGSRLRSLAPLLPFYDVDTKKVPLIGTVLWDDPSLINEPALDGALFAAPGPAGRAAFRDRFQATYQRRPPRVASLAYDAIALVGALAADRDAATEDATQSLIAKPPLFDSAALSDDAGFAGYDGIFRLRPDGTVERGLAVVKITATGFQVVEPAPTDFDALTN